MRWVLVGLLLLGLLSVIACGDSEEDLDDESQATPGVSATAADLSPTTQTTAEATPTPISTERYEDPSGIFAVDLPQGWSPESPESEGDDLVTAVEFSDETQLTRAGVTVWSNSTGTGLEDWVRDRNVLFFEDNAVESMVLGYQALFSDRNFQGQARGAAYLAADGYIILLSGLTLEDYEALLGGMEIDI